jgi:hypothetical protein
MDGIIEDLDRLHDEGRRRFVKRCSREELEEIIVAAWRIRDEAKEQPKGRSYSAQHSFRTGTDVQFKQLLFKMTTENLAMQQTVLPETVRSGFESKVIDPLTK